MRQSWQRLAFLHWRVDAALLSALLPRTIEPDTFDGSAWIGVTPFVVRGLRLRYIPPLPLLSHFPELNVRTYVTRNGRPGIWFLSLDTPNVPAVIGARRAYRLPYHRARIDVDEGDEVRYRLDRAGEARFSATYRPAGPVYNAAPGSFEQFAAERYCLYTVDAGLRPLRADIHHAPWPLQAASAELELNTMARPYGIELDGEPVVHYAHRQDVVIWALGPDEPRAGS
jgi:uncharacterized protein